MIVLVPLLSGKENNSAFIEAITNKTDKVILLQIVDREFMNKTSAAMGEVMQFSSLLTEIKKAVTGKKKKCEEITEWGQTTKKLISVAVLQKVDKVILVEQKNQFFNEIIKELDKNKISYESVKVVEAEKVKKGLFDNIPGFGKR